MTIPLKKLFLLMIAVSLTVAVGPQNSKAAQAAPTQLTVWMFPGAPEGSAPPADWIVYKKVHDELNIDLKFTMIPLGADGETKLNAQAAANDLPDFFQLPTNRDIFFNYVKQGLLAPTKDLLPLMPKRTAARYSQENLNKLVTVDGVMYGLQEPAQLYKRYGLVIRQDWLTKLGLKAPTTLEEFLTVAQAFTTQDPDGNGKNDTFGFGAVANPNIPNGLGMDFDFIFGAYGLPGVWHLNDPKTFGLNVQQPGYQPAVAFLRRLNEAKVIDPDWPTLSRDEFRSRWKQGRFGMFVEDFCALICKANYSDFDKNNPAGQLSIIAPPVGPSGASAVTTFEPIGAYYAVSQKAIDAGKGAAIAKFLEWSHSGEGYMLLGFGVKGVNYNLDDKGNIITTGIAPELIYSSKQQQPILQMKTLAYIGTDVELRARYVTFQTANGRTIDPLDYYKATFNSPYVDDTAAQLIQPAPNQADIVRYVGENIDQFVLSQKPLDDKAWASFISGFDGLGIADWSTNAQATLQKAGFIAK